MKGVQEQNDLSRGYAIAYPRASTTAYLRAHQNSKFVPPDLIHRAITCDSLKALAQKPRRSCVTIESKDP